MEKAVLYLDKHFPAGRIDRRLFGSFLEHLGRAVYQGIYQPGQASADEHGFRRDTLDLVRELQVPIVRYPGGNFLSAYNWEDTVGPREARPRRTDPAWSSIETNEFGMNDFMDWCRAAGTEPMMAVNLGTRGVDAAKNVLEYCNFPGGTYYSDLRRSHGWEKPHGVKVWCLGNEMDGPWQIGQKKAWEYGHLASQTARVMRAIDPDIELVACGSSTATMSSFGSWELEMLEECYDDVDHLSMHAYYGKFTGDSRDLLACPVEMDRFINAGVAMCDAMQAKKRSRRRLSIAFDEWNVNYHFRMSRSNPADWREWYLTSPTFEQFREKFLDALPKDPPYAWETAPHRLEDVYTLEDAVAFGGLLISLLRHCDRVHIACQAQLVNVIAPILTTDRGAWRQTIFYPYLHAAACTGSVLQTRVQGPRFESRVYGEVDCIDCAPVLSPDERTLTLLVVNRDLENPIELECDLRQFEGWQVESHLVLNHEDLLAANTEQAPETVTPRAAQMPARLEGGVLHAPLEKHSWNVIRIRDAATERGN